VYVTVLPVVLPVFNFPSHFYICSRLSKVSKTSYNLDQMFKEDH